MASVRREIQHWKHMSLQIRDLSSGIVRYSPPSTEPLLLKTCAHKLKTGARVRKQKRIRAVHIFASKSIHQLVVPEFCQLRSQSKVRGHQEIGPVIVLQAIIIIVVLRLVKALPKFH